MNDITIKTAILGASGYTGAELLRLIRHHPNVSVEVMTADSQAGKKIGEVYAHLAPYYGHELVTIDEVDFTNIDLVFCCLPHATTQKVIASLPEHVRVVDLSADFRLHDLETYNAWYGHEHYAPELQKQAVYGLSEIYRDDIKNARLVANPGCYPTSIILPLFPLVQDGLIDADNIVVSSMSGVTGAGRSVKQELLYCEVNESAKAYGVGGHRHVAEIEQELTRDDKPVIRFTPHLVPMNRGISSTIYVKMSGEPRIDSLHATLDYMYGEEPFVHLLPMGQVPATGHVRGTNACHIGVSKDRKSGHAMIVSVIDNVVKGASGQAIQNMNIMFGLDETIGLTHTAMMP